MNRRTVLRSSMGVLVFAGHRSRAVAADEPDDEKARADAALAVARREADAYTVRHEGSDGEPLRRRAEAVLRWSNPDVGSIHGSVFLWTANGRPEVVASLYKWYHPFTHRSHEFHSLALGPLVVERDGATVWSPARAGVEFKKLPEAGEPGASAAVRLRQMREFARDFTAAETPRATSEEPEPKEFALRLLSQPIYRYEGTAGDLIDGALFVFVKGTDPELFLLLEARRVGGRPQWQYALARMNGVVMRANHKGHEVFNVPVLPASGPNDPREPYIKFQFR